MFDFDQMTDEQLLEAANRAGEYIARKYAASPDDAEDLVMEAILAMAGKSLKPETKPGYVYTVLKNCAEEHLQTQRYEAMVEQTTYRYTNAEVRLLLTAVCWKDEDPDNPYSHDMKWLHSDTEQPISVNLKDFQVAWDKVRPAQRKELQRVFRDDGEVKDRKKLSRAVDAMVRALNWRVNRQEGLRGPGSRRAMSNAAGQALTEKDREGSPLPTWMHTARTDHNPPGTHFNWN